MGVGQMGAQVFITCSADIRQTLDCIDAELEALSALPLTAAADLSTSQRRPKKDRRKSTTTTKPTM